MAEYGLPRNTAINYGASGFPPWVYELCDRFGLKASTYPGHQSNQRGDIKAAPNPQGLNRGIDWAGPAQNMLDFARWLRDTAPPGLEMVIYQDPRSGEQVGYPTWVSYGGDYGGHTDHVHTRQSQSLIAGEFQTKNDPADVLARATGIDYDWAAQVLPQVRGGLTAAECTSAKRAAMWLAQVGHESDDFKATEEYADGDESTDRWRYKGRTWIQITWRANYAGFSQWCHARGLVPNPNYFVDNPSHLAEQRWAGLGPAWYWTVARPQINAMCDNGDIMGVTKAINGGTNGLDTPNGRRERYSRAMGLGDDLLILTRATSQEDDDMSAEAERQIGELYRALLTPVPSLSGLRMPGEGNAGTVIQLLRNIDGMTHPIYAALAALLGDPDELRRLDVVSRTTEPGRGKNAVLAATILDRIYSDEPAKAQKTGDALPSGIELTGAPQPLPQAPTYAQPTAQPFTPVVPTTPGTQLGRAFDALMELRLNTTLPSDVKAPLEALIGVLQTYPQEKS